MTGPETTDTGIETPYLIIERDDTVYGRGSDGRTIVRIKHDDMIPVDGVLPDSLITSAPHVETPVKAQIDDDRVRYIPLANAPDWYRKTIKTEIIVGRWVTRANWYYQNSGAGEMEAIIMAVGEHTDAVGAGQPAVISDLLGWSEEEIGDILTELQTTRYDAYRRDSGVPPHESV